MGTLNDYYTAAVAVPPPNRRWVVGAGYALYEKVQLFGYSLAASKTAILSLPQYSNALTATGLLATFNAIDTFPGVGAGAGLLQSTTSLSSTTMLVSGGLQ